MFGTRIPYYDPRLTKQVKRADVNDKFYHSLFEPPKFLLIHRIVQFLCFFIFLGPIKLLFTFVLFIIWFVLIRIIPLFEGFFKNQKSYKNFSQKILRNIARAFLFSTGVIKINMNGSINPDARFIVSNHISLLDFFVYFAVFPITIIKKAEIPGWESLLTGTVIDMFYIKPRDQYVTPAEQLEHVASDPSYHPILHFPEDRPTNGNSVLAFKTPAFGTDYYVQISSISYFMGFTFQGFNTVASTDDFSISLFLRLLAMPFIICQIDFLQPKISKTELPNQISASQKAEDAQIQIANDLGVLAISRGVFQPGNSPRK